MTDWEARYQEGDTPWDKSGPHPALAAAAREATLSGRGLVPGCGLGYDVMTLLGEVGVTEVVGIDIAPSAILASQKTLLHQPRASVRREDLFALPKAWRGSFDWVWEHTCFCAIEPTQRNAYVQAIAETLRPGGLLLAVFYLRPWDSEAENASLGPPYATSEIELDRRFAPRFEIIRTWSPEVTYPGREDREQMRLLRRA
jgi:methyl halide transferase